MISVSEFRNYSDVFQYNNSYTHCVWLTFNFQKPLKQNLRQHSHEFLLFPVSRLPYSFFVIIPKFRNILNSYQHKHFVKFKTFHWNESFERTPPIQKCPRKKLCNLLKKKDKISAQTITSNSSTIISNKSVNYLV